MTLKLSDTVTVYQFGSSYRSNLLVKNGASILFDCHSSLIKDELLTATLPLPDMIIHTHIQTQHTKEGKIFKHIDILVPEPLFYPQRRRNRTIIN